MGESLLISDQKMVEIPKFLLQSVAELDLKYSVIKKLQLRRYSAGPGTEWSMQIGLHHERNRYSNVVPYDKTRVKLQVERGYDDYINASRIKIDLGQFAVSPKNYILSQGPTRDTSNIFWQMCFDEMEGDRIIIVMVTPLEENGMEKCYKYWPAVGDSLELPGGSMFNDRTLVLELTGSETVQGVFDLTKMQLTDSTSGKKKEVYHLYYDQWRDFSKPTGFTPVKLLSDYADSVSTTKNDPLVVHCSAGVGRTGTFITLNYLLTYTKLFLTDDLLVKDQDLIQDVVYQLREQRLLMVERFEQFTFIYESLRRFYMEKFGKNY